MQIDIESTTAAPIDTILVTAESLNSEGKAVARLPEESGPDKGMTVFIEGLLPGEKAHIRLTSRKKGYAEATLDELLTPSPQRMDPFCTAYPACGGCSMQHMKYAPSLAAKRRYIVGCLSRIGGLPHADAEHLVAPTIGMTHPYDYRNHMQYPVAETVPAVPSPMPISREKHDVVAPTAAPIPTLAPVASEPSLAAAPAPAPEATVPAPVAATASAPATTPAPRDLRIGLYAAKTHDIVPHTACRIAHPACESIRKITERFLLAQNIPGFDEATRRGFLRHLIVRVGVNTGEIMVILVTGEETDPRYTFPARPFIDEASRRLEKDRKRLLRDNASEAAPVASETSPAYTRALLETPWKIKSLWLARGAALEATGVRVRTGNAEALTLLWGDKTIQETIGDRTFQISPCSFFQVNTEQTHKLYDIVRRYAIDAANDTATPPSAVETPATQTTCPEDKWPVDYSETGLAAPAIACTPSSAPSTDAPAPAALIPLLLDVYCGTGTIGLYLSDLAERILGLEISESAVQDALRNAELNGVTTARYRAARAETLTPADFPAEKPVVILDPPRKGCEKPLIDTLLRLAPPHIIYVSCDPATLARDLALLRAGGYVVKAATPVDMFPWTTHVETVVWVEREEKTKS